MVFSCLTLWITSMFSNRRQNEVEPIQIKVRPKLNVNILDGESHEECECNITVFAIEDELRFSRLWYPTENSSSSRPAILDEPARFEDDVGESIGTTIQPSGPSLNEENHANRSKLNQIPTRPAIILSIQNCGTKIWNDAMNILRAMSKAIRITQPQNYIRSYLHMMFIFCVSAVPIWSNESNSNVGFQKWSYWISLHLQRVIFVLFAALSAFQSFCQAKYNVLWFLFEGGINEFVKFSFNVTSLLTSAFFSYLLCRETKVMKTMIEVLRAYERNWVCVINYRAICVAFAIVTVFLSSLRSLLIIDISDFSVERVMLESSYQLSEDLFLWSSNNLNISMQKLGEEFGVNLSLTDTLLGVVKVLRDFAYNLQDGMMWDLIGCVVFTLFFWMNIFMKEVTEVVDNVLNESSQEWRALQHKREQVWTMYREIRIVFEAVNNMFDPLLIFYHVSNVLRYAFFMENVIYPEDVSLLTYVHLLYNIVKSEITYIVASKIAHQNIVIRKWLRNWGSRTGKIDVGYTEIEMYAVLDELEAENLGLGKGELIIHQGFHFGLLGLVSSLFVTLASKKT